MRFISSYTASSSTSQLQLHPNVLRRFPLAVRIGVHGLQELHQQYRRHWTSPISKLEELFYNPFIREQRLRKKMEIKMKPASRWKPLKVKVKQSPCHLSSVISSERAYETTLMRSPERVVGLKDALRPSARTRGFGLKEAIMLSYCRNHSFVLFTCLLLGLGIWWTLIPDPLLVHPKYCCSPEMATQLKEATGPECGFRQSGFQCPHTNHIHDKVMEAFTEPKVFDPLGLKPSTRTVGLAVMLGVIVLSLALGESVTETGTLL